MNKFYIAVVGVALVTLTGCASTGTTASAPVSTMAKGEIPWAADDSTLPPMGPFDPAPWTAEGAELPAIAPKAEFTDYKPL